MLAYSTTNAPEDGPILANPFADEAHFACGRHLERLEGATHRRRSKLATDKMGRASTAARIPTGPRAE